MGKQFRPSKLPMVMKCGAAAIVPEVPIPEPSGKPADVGSAVHEMLAQVVKEDLEAPPDPEPFAHKYGLTDLKELRILAWNGLRMWENLRETVSVIDVECPLESKSVKIGGTADILAFEESEDGDCLVLADWKSGRVDSDYDDQLMCYLWMYWTQQWNVYDRAKIVVLWVRDKKQDVIEVSREGMANWYERFEQAIFSDEEQAGDHCTYCPRKHECATYKAWLQACARQVMLFKDGDNTELDHLDMALLWPGTRALVSAVEKYKKAMHGVVIEHGPIPTGDGKELLIKKSKREDINVTKGYGILSANVPGCDPESLDFIKKFGHFLTVKKAELLDDIGLRAAGITKKKAKDEVLDDLRSANAMDVKETEGVSWVKEKKK